MRRSFAVLLVLAAPLALFAGDPAAPVIVTPWWVGLLSNETVGSVLMAVITAAVGWATHTARGQKIRDMITDEKEAKVDEAALATYHALWKGIKAKYGADVPEEKKAEARDHAFDEFKKSVADMAKGPIKDAMIEVGKKEFVPMLERAIGKAKRENSGD